MASLFTPKPPAPVPVVNPADTANRANQALVRRLASGGTNADSLTVPSGMAAVGGPRPGILTGLN